MAEEVRALLTIRKLFRQLQPTKPRPKYVAYTKDYHKFLLDVPSPYGRIFRLQNTPDTKPLDGSLALSVFKQMEQT
mgnify:CR=1 FL=1